MLNKVLYLVFGDVRNQNDEDLEDICQNIKHFDSNAQIIINHPKSSHPNSLLKHEVGVVDHSYFIFGVFIEFLNYIKDKKLDFDHVCLFSANQYMINSFYPIKGINYLQFYTTDDWDFKYTGKDYSNLTYGTPLMQYKYIDWEPERLDLLLGVEYAMVSNWESAYITKETIKLCIENLDTCLSVYPNKDRIQTYPGYMALKTGQPWLYPPFFGTFDPSNRINGHNRIITQQQVIQKYNEGYCSVKRAGYTKNCLIKEFIRSKYENS